MIRRLKKSVLFKNTFIYTLLQLVNSGIPFLLLPILTRYLTPEDYGKIATYNTLVGALGIFVGLSMAGAVGVSYFQLKKEALQRYIGNVFIVLSVTTLIVWGVVALLQPYLEAKLQLPAKWLFIAIAVALMQTVTAVNLTLWRSQQRAKPFALYEMAQTLFNITLSLLLVVVLHYGWEGRVTGTAAAAVVFGVLSVVFIYKRGYAALDFSRTFIKDILKFGVPLIPHQLALWMRSGVDILLITAILGATHTGLYNVGFQFGMVVGLFASAFNNAFSPYLYERLREGKEEVKRNLVKFTYIYFVGIVLFAMVLSTFFVWLIPHFLGEKFHGASHYVYLISLAFAFQGMYLMVVNYIFYAKKNHLLSMVTISTSLFHVGLSYILIRHFGAIGAAYASVVSFLVTFLLVWRISSRMVEMPWTVLRR